jgi:hypothetical protein
MISDSSLTPEATVLKESPAVSYSHSGNQEICYQSQTIKFTIQINVPEGITGYAEI